MALLTLEGIYRDGRVELAEVPASVNREARVLVTFLPSGQEARPSPAERADEARREAAARLLARFERGIDYGGPPYLKREELYDRIERLGQSAG